MLISRSILLGVLLFITACANAETQRSADARYTPAAKEDRIEALTKLFSRNFPRHIVVVAHRACWAQGAPENSIPAIESCISSKMDMIEIDVALTADNVPVLMHDATINRTTNGNGAISEIELSDLKALRLRNRDGGKESDLTQYHVPTLSEALQKARGKILINLDIKGDAFDEAFEVVRSLGMENQILMKMAAFPESKSLSTAAFRGKTMFMPIIRECTSRYKNSVCSVALSEAIQGYDDYDPVAYEVTFSSEDYLEEGLAAIAMRGRRVWANSLAPHHAANHLDEDAVLDPAGVWGGMINMGIGIIQTDEPEALLKYLQETDRRAQL